MRALVVVILTVSWRECLGDAPVLCHLGLDGIGQTSGKELNLLHLCHPAAIAVVCKALFRQLSLGFLVYGCVRI